MNRPKIKKLTLSTLPIVNLNSIDHDCPTLAKHFPECFSSLKTSLLNSNDLAQAKVSQLIHGFNDRIKISKNDLEIKNLNSGIEELRACLKATVQSDIKEYLEA